MHGGSDGACCERELQVEHKNLGASNGLAPGAAGACPFLLTYTSLNKSLARSGAHLKFAQAIV